MPDQGDVKTEIQVIEYFAGVGRIARMAHAVGLQSTAVDLEYGGESKGFRKTQFNGFELKRGPCPCYQTDLEGQVQ